MNVLVSASARFAETKDGRVWTPNPALDYTFWSRYLDVFDEVGLVVRARPVAVPPPGWREVSGRGLRPLPLPYYEGPLGFALNALQIRRTLRTYVASADVVIARLPCALGSTLLDLLPKGHPYGIELVGDPYDVFSPGAVRHPLRPFLRWWWPRSLRKRCRDASGVAYVTREKLQQRYPASATAFETSYSSIDLPSAYISDAPWVPPSPPRRARLVAVGSLAQLYKGTDVLIDAIGRLRQQGVETHLTVVGDGRYRESLQEQARLLGLSDSVVFTGQLAGTDEVRKVLDGADLFVMPSRTEGLPKALIEAMARGLPCVGTSIGAIPELLDASDLVPPGEAQALMEKLKEVLADPDRMMMMAARNLSQARGYEQSVLRDRRVEFYRYLKSLLQDRRPLAQPVG